MASSAYWPQYRNSISTSTATKTATSATLRRSRPLNCAVAVRKIGTDPIENDKQGDEALGNPAEHVDALLSVGPPWPIACAESRNRLARCGSHLKPPSAVRVSLARTAIRIYGYRRQMRRNRRLIRPCH